MCTAILLGAPHINSIEKQKCTNTNTNTNKIDDKFTTTPSHPRPHLRTQLSRRTLGKTNCTNLHDPATLASTNIKEENETLIKDGEEAGIHSSTGITSRSDTESQDDDDEDDDGNEGLKKSRNKVLEWTEDDQRNLMDLGSSEIERNKRLESLIAKRRARKLLSMQPRRNHYPYENLMDHVGSITITRCCINDVEHQPGSAPCALLPSRNPFDLPYDPHEEKPILTGGSFDEEFFPDEPREGGKEEGCSSKREQFTGESRRDPIGKFGFTSMPKTVDKPSFTRFRIASGS